MSMLKEAFAAGKFGVTAEMAPPKGYDFSEQLEAAKLLNGKVHGVNVTWPVRRAQERGRRAHFADDRP